MKILRYIYLLLAVVSLAACHDADDLQKNDSNLPDPDVYISFRTRAPGIDDDSWLLLPMPGQNTNTVEDKTGKEFEVAQHIGVYGYFTNDDASRVIEIENPVFDNEVLEEYDEHEKYPSDGDGNVKPEDAEKRREEFYDEQEKPFLAAAGEEKGGFIFYFNGAVENTETGEEIVGPTNTGDSTTIIESEYPKVDTLNGSITYSNGTIYYYKAVEVVFPDGYSMKSDGMIYHGNDAIDPRKEQTDSVVTYDGNITVTRDSRVTIKGIPSKELDATGGSQTQNPDIESPITGQTTFDVEIEPRYSTEQKLYYYIQFSDNTPAISLYVNIGGGNTSGEITEGEVTDGNGTQGDPTQGGQGSPAKGYTRADANYDDYDDKYYYGYNHQRWMSEDYMFYSYAPASRNAKIDIDPATGDIGGFTWEKIPCVSTSDLVVAKEEVWRKNKDAATADVSRIHFDDMQHLMARIRLYFAVHPDFHKTRRVVITQASLSFKEEGFKKVYTFENKRTSDGDKEHGKETWKWTVDDRYAYNPRYNNAFYSAYKEVRPKDMVVYQNRSGAQGYGKLLAPLPTNGDWHPENLFTDFFIVPYDNNVAEEMTLHVKYYIYDTDPDVNDEKISVDGADMPYYSKAHIMRECQRESTITFKAPGLKFRSGVSHALKIMINPDYIYVLGDHDEPADMIIR